jgi:Tol biopolymer transport system component
MSRVKTISLLPLVVSVLVACGEKQEPGPNKPASEAKSPAVARKPFENEKRFRNLRQLTFGGENAEAYWSFKEDYLIFQSTRGDLKADQIFIMRPDGSDVRMVSTGGGRTTCSYFLPGDKQILYASTRGAGKEPPAPPDMSKGYVWALYKTYNIYVANADGSNAQKITDLDGYDAEATVSPTGDKIVFTSTRDGDIDLYSMDLGGENVTRLTDRPGYDGGAFYSWDGTKIVWRAPGLDDDVTKTDYHPLLKQGLIRPNRLEIWIMDADGSNKKQVTNNGKANFGPFWHPDGKRIIFASNMDDPKGANFELYLVTVATGEVERVTYFARTREGAHRSDDFDGFPMFNHDATKLVFCSNRHNEKPNETNVFVVDWVDDADLEDK